MVAPTTNSKKIYCEELVIHPIRVNISYASLATTTDKPQDKSVFNYCFLIRLGSSERSWELWELQ